MSTNVLKTVVEKIDPTAIVKLEGPLNDFHAKEVATIIDDLLEKNENPDDLTVREAISGNLCRCTGYGRILEAVQIAAASRREEKHE